MMERPNLIIIGKKEELWIKGKKKKYIQQIFRRTLSQPKVVHAYEGQIAYRISNTLNQIKRPLDT